MRPFQGLWMGGPRELLVEPRTKVSAAPSGHLRPMVHWKEAGLREGELLGMYEEGLVDCDRGSLRGVMGGLRMHTIVLRKTGLRPNLSTCIRVWMGNAGIVNRKSFKA
jgi:hypothetical protein